MSGTLYNNRRGRRNPMPRRNNNGMMRYNNQTQNYDSNGPGVRVKGTAQQIYDKYTQLARDAMGSDDRVLVENYLQHAEHYYRLAFPEGSEMARWQQHQQEEAQNQLDFADSEAAEEEEGEVQPAVRYTNQGANFPPTVVSENPQVDVYSSPCSAPEIDDISMADDQGEMSLARQLTLRSRQSSRQADDDESAPRQRQPRRFAIKSAAGAARNQTSVGEESDNVTSLQQVNEDSHNAENGQSDGFRQRRSWRNPSGRSVAGRNQSGRIAARGPGSPSGSPSGRPTGQTSDPES